jgi:L-fucose isomerase-like protein
MPALPVLPLSSLLSGHSSLVLENVVEKFRGLGVDLLPKGEEEIAKEPLSALLFLTGGTEHMALEFARGVRKPLLLLAHFGHNSLPAALETLARLREEGRKAWLLTEADGEELPRFAQVAALAHELFGKRVGLIGGASPWLVASSPDFSAFWEKLGLEIVEVPLSALRERIPEEAEILPEGEALGVGESERRMAGRVYAGLRALIADYRLSALSIACFGLLSEGCTACWALAHLSDAGLPAGCEGDLPALLALWLGRLVSGYPGFLANPAEVDWKRERLLLAHCTVPLSLAESFALRTHFESGIGLAVAGRVKPGPYTLFRLGGKRLEKAFIVEGTVLPEWPGRENLCRTQVWFKMPKGALEKLLREPLGNHHVLIPGHHRPILRLFHEVFLSD